MTEKGTAQWTLRKTPDRQELMNELRELLDEFRPREGERIHGQLTDAQIFDWAMGALLGNLIERKTEVGRREHADVLRKRQ